MASPNPGRRRGRSSSALGQALPWLETAGGLALAQATVLAARHGGGLDGTGWLALASGSALVLAVLLALGFWLVSKAVPKLAAQPGAHAATLPRALFGLVLSWTLVELALGPSVQWPLALALQLLAALATLALVRRLPPSPRWLSAALAAILPIGLVLGWLDLAPPATIPQTGRPAANDAADVVLVTIDTLRADRLGIYGRDPSPTPNLDRLGAEGAVLERTLASSPWTVPSIASLMTGQPTLEHGAGLPVAPGRTFLRTGLGDDHTTLAEHFSRAGYRTSAVVANAFLGPARGLAQGFEQFENPWLEHSRAGVWLTLPTTRWLARRLPAERLGDPRARGVVDRALELLDAPDSKGRPTFLWLHLIDPHAPYQADPDHLELVDVVAELEAEPMPDAEGSLVGDRFVQAHRVRGGSLWLAPTDRQRLEAHYDRAVSYTDHHLGRLFEALRRHPRPVVVALTADHGEEFWDHGQFEHGHDYYREVTWVPAIFWAPDRVRGGQRIAEPAGLVDLGPTLLELAGLEPPPEPAWWEGWSLAGALTPAGSDGSNVSGDPAALDLPPRLAGGNLYGFPAVALVDGPWRYILRANGQDELYHVETDPGERRNLAFLEPAVAARYRALLEPRLRVHLEVGDPSSRPADPADLDALRSLGYVQ